MLNIETLSLILYSFQYRHCKVEQLVHNISTKNLNDVNCNVFQYCIVPNARALEITSPVIHSKEPKENLEIWKTLKQHAQNRFQKTVNQNHEYKEYRNIYFLHIQEYHTTFLCIFAFLWHAWMFLWQNSVTQRVRVKIKRWICIQKRLFTRTLYSMFGTKKDF